MRVIFMGSPDFAVPTLDALVAAGHDVVAVYTQPPRPAGRGKQLQPTAIEVRARELGIDVRCPKSLKSDVEKAAFAALDVDVAVVAAYGLILPLEVLNAPKLGCVNVHASLLPRWRGAAPVQRAIMAGDDVTGVTIMQMEAGLDTGPMLLKREIPIDRKNAAQLTEELAITGAELMTEFLANPDDYPPEPQAEGAVTHAAKIRKEEARIDWAFPAPQILHQIRGLSPFPGAWFAVDGERIKVIDADITDNEGRPGEVLDDALVIACGEGAFRPLLVQRAGKGVMTADELLRGFAIPKGAVLS